MLHLIHLPCKTKKNKDNLSSFCLGASREWGLDVLWTDCQPGYKVLLWLWVDSWEDSHETVRQQHQEGLRLCNRRLVLLCLFYVLLLMYELLHEYPLSLPLSPRLCLHSGERNYRILPQGAGRRRSDLHTSLDPTCCLQHGQSNPSEGF